MLTLVSKDSVKGIDHFDVLCVLIASMVLEIINQMSKNQKSSLIVWNTVQVLNNVCAGGKQKLVKMECITDVQSSRHAPL